MERRRASDNYTVEDIRIKGLASIIRLNSLFSHFFAEQNELLSIFAAETSRLFSCGCSIYIRNKDQLDLAVFHGALPSDVISVSCKNTPATECRAVRDRIPLVFDGKQPCERKRSIADMMGIYACIPIMIDNDVMEVVNILLPEKKSISNNEFNLLIAMTEQLSNTLHRHRLFNNLKTEKERLESANKEIVTLNEQLSERLREMEKMQAHLIESQKLEAIGRLAGGIAHDFNNILVAVIGYSQIAVSSLGEHTPTAKYIQRVLDAADRAQALTKQILALSRKQVMNVQVINPNTLISGFKNILRTLLSENIEINLFLSPDIFNIKADPYQIEQVIMNLAANARDAMPKGGQFIIQTENIELDESEAKPLALEVGKYIMLSVSDTGIGMTEDIKQHIFEPFYTTKDVGKGTGLGMAVSYGIIKQHGGAIEVESVIGKGTNFKIYFPVAVESESVRQTAVCALSDKDLMGADENILLVEDDPEVLSVIKSHMSTLGYKITTASNGKEALMLAKNMDKKYDLLITDVIMPLMDGKELAAEVKKILPDIKVLFISGYPQDKIRTDDILCEGTEFLSKPFSKEEIALKIKTVLQSK